ncbi:class I SAM-dependent methyltransferase [Amycolatopsis minnesotensis]|uniref:Methyltransferase domain-containing protein n=1 Tax=Amycolatopsis minnesotensis TaxID=337894 RepID=A0ABN2S4W6_9PSEU
MKAWQEEWDRLMAVYQPRRDEGVTAAFDLIDAVVDGGRPEILDLGGGTGSLCRSALARWPGAGTTLLDLDPVLMTIARETLPPAARLVTADLDTAAWTGALPHREYDAVVAVMALHYLPPGRVTALYAEIAGVLRGGGLLVVLDHMPDPGLPALSGRLRHRLSDADASNWNSWWTRAAADPVLGPAAAARTALLADRPSAEWTPPTAWHIDALRAAGYAEAGTGWRHGTHAAVVAVAGTAGKR